MSTKYFAWSSKKSIKYHMDLSDLEKKNIHMAQIYTYTLTTKTRNVNS
jgi:hypothetical protein